MAALLLLQGCMSMGPKSVITEPVFDLVALQRASMGEVAKHLGFDIDGEQSYVKEKANKTIWKYNELDIRSNGGISLTGESSSLSYEFYFNQDDEFDDGVADYGAVTEIRYYKEQ